MGRPLFVARVESDLPSEKTAGYARSPIRRRVRRNNGGTGMRAHSIPAVPNWSRTEESGASAHIRDHETLAQLARVIDETARPLRGPDTRPTRNEEIPTYALQWGFQLDSERTERERMRRLVQQGRVSQASRAAHRASPPGERSLASRLTSSRRFGLPDQASARPSISRYRRAFDEYPSPRGDAGFDGLGDRDRSLSPEGVHVWDTLLTSITPDPQPPSLGSSFASTAASQSAAGSATTSFTEPDATPETAIAADPGCESGADERDTSDAEDDEDLMPAIASGFRRHIPRSHPSSRPAAPPRAPESGNDSMDDMGSMIRIRQLAQRHNVPISFMAEIERILRERQSLS